MAAVTMHTHTIHREHEEERRELAVLPPNDPTPRIVYHAYGVSQKQKTSLEREREKVLSDVSTGLWEYAAVLQCPEHRKIKLTALKRL